MESDVISTTVSLAVALKQESSEFCIDFSRYLRTKHTISGNVFT